MAFSADALKLYPDGQISFGSGNIQDATATTLNINNNAKTVNTLSGSAKGVTIGPLEVSGSIAIMVSQDGMEHDWISMVLAGAPQEFNFKMPLATAIINGVTNTVGIQTEVGGGIKIDVGFVGKASAT